MSWKEIFQSVNDTELVFFEPIKKHELEQIEKTLGVTLSGQLLELLEESNGIKDNRFGDFLVGSSSEIIELHNLNLGFSEQAGITLPHVILFFANNGCGEYFGFRIKEGKIADGKVGVYYPLDNDFRIVAPDFKTWAIEWYSGILTT